MCTKNVRITREELAILILWPVNDLESLNTPDLGAEGFASSLPGFLTLGSLCLELSVFFATQASNVGGG